MKGQLVTWEIRLRSVVSNMCVDFKDIKAETRNLAADIAINHMATPHHWRMVMLNEAGQ